MPLAKLDSWGDSCRECRLPVRSSPAGRNASSTDSPNDLAKKRVAGGTHQSASFSRGSSSACNLGNGVRPSRWLHAMPVFIFVAVATPRLVKHQNLRHASLKACRPTWLKKADRRNSSFLTPAFERMMVALGTLQCVRQETVVATSSRLSFWDL